MIKLPAPVMKHVGRQLLVLQKNSPTIMLASGVVGVVGSTVLACRATLKLDEVFAQSEATKERIHSVAKDERYTEVDATKDLAVLKVMTARNVAKLYLPAVGLGLVSVGLLVGSHKVMSTRNAGLMAAYAALDKGFQEYRSRVIADVGDEKEKEYRYGKTVEILTNEDGTTTRVVQATGEGRPSIYARYFDQFSKNWNKTPMYNQMFLRTQQNFANDLLQSRGHLFLNEVYDMLGISRTPAGALVGWVMDSDGDNYVDFGVFDGDTYQAMRFVNGDENSILLDFNVDGVIYDKIN